MISEPSPLPEHVHRPDLSRFTDLATRTPVPEIAASLVEHLGPTLTAFITGAASRSLPPRWAAASTTPRHSAVVRLTFAYRCWLAVSASDGFDVARNWFIGTHPALDEASPAEAIRTGDARTRARVWAAVTAFVNDDHGF